MRADATPVAGERCRSLRPGVDLTRTSSFHFGSAVRQALDTPGGHRAASPCGVTVRRAGRPFLTCTRSRRMSWPHLDLPAVPPFAPMEAKLTPSLAAGGGWQ